MCLYPKLIRNKKYTDTKKNQNRGFIPPVLDSRTEYVPIGCGNCMECRKQKAREWQVRLSEDIKTNTNGKFITLTFSNESIKELHRNIINYTTIEIARLKKLPKTPDILKKIDRQWQLRYGYAHDNEIATRAVRLFLERWRKKYGKSLRHWLITELGHNGTENIHLHGIIWMNTASLEELERIWQYGFIWKGKKIAPTPNNPTGIENYVNEKTVNYIVKYINKVDEKHTQYKSKMLTSAGIGSNYIEQKGGDWNKNKYKEELTIETYKTKVGLKIALPIYYRNKIYTEEEKEKLWIKKIDKETRYVLGNKISIKNGEEEYYKALKTARELNKELGYRDDSKNWEQAEYENACRKLKLKTRIQNTKSP